MLRRQRLDAVNREGDLKIDRLLAPQRAVVVEGGDALFERNKISCALHRDSGDKIRDGFFRGPFVPGWQRVQLR
jgi:hypothetical protein